MPDTETAPVLEQEIRELERKQAEKKRSLEACAAPGEPPEEKTVFREVIREHIEGAAEGPPAMKAAAQPTSPKLTSLPQDAAKAQADEIREEEHKKQVEALLAIAFSKGIVNAVNVARHLGDPHLLDEFHDTLADEYYEKLLSARVIMP